MLELTIIQCYNLILSQSQLRCPAFPQLQRETGGVGKVSPIGWAHLWKGEGGEGGSWLYVLNKHFWGHGQPHTWENLDPTSQLTLTPVRGLRIWALESTWVKVSLLRTGPWSTICGKYMRQKHLPGQQRLYTKGYHTLPRMEDFKMMSSSPLLQPWTN